MSKTHRTKGRVLIVDDEPSIRAIVSKVLSKAQYEVVEAGASAKAITYLNEGGNALMVDTIICDLQMPEFDGTELINYLRAHYPSIPVVVLTGRPDVGQAASLMQRGVMDYLIKPVCQDVLLQVIRKAVSLRRTLKNQSEA